MKEFNIERAKVGDPVIYMDVNGYMFDVRIICFDRKDIDHSLCVIALVKRDTSHESPFGFDIYGKTPNEGIGKLYMLPIKKELWRNGYRDELDCIILKGDEFPNKLSCRSAADKFDPSYVGPVLIREWEE